ncbi:hypothetical protein BOX15_Mlig016207g2 [Macrostomum lignano]|uniref:CUB domain-containing protein n=1 Tax=Macrostomum lignano TaxID=282301 RepID=A0A267ECG8_9PLAT|nr:hypothetical protein BOX15_Mlig016207g2 [Macrostomum lignano]
MGKYVLLSALATLILCLNISQHNVESKTRETYYLTRDCQYQNGAAGTGKGVMRTRVTSAQILSHRFGKEPYPANFSCEVYLSTRSTDRFLVWFNHLYIPDVDQMCENVLHCFNTNTPISEGMQEAGGQTGLCKRSYPKQPLVTTAHYFTFTFRSKPDRLPADMLADSSAGFRLTVTSVGIPDAKTRACPATKTSTKALAPSSLSSPAASAPTDSGAGAGANLLGADEVEQLRRCTFRRAAPPLMPPHSLPMSAIDGGAPAAGSATSAALMPLTTWCLPVEALCDGLANCPDSTDEQPICRRDVSLMSRLLSLGVAASVAMGVGAVALGMGCVLGLACCCYRALSSEPPPNTASAVPNAAMTTLHHSPGQAQHLLQLQHQQRLLLPARQSPSVGLRRPPPEAASYAGNSSHYSLADSSGGGRYYQQQQKPPVSYQQQQQRAYNSTEQLFGYGNHVYHQQQQHPHSHYHQHPQAQCRLCQHHPPPASHHGGFSGGAGGSRTPTSSRSAKSGRSGRSSYGPGHQIRPVPPPSRADSETGTGHLHHHQQPGNGSRDRIVYPVQL